MDRKKRKSISKSEKNDRIQSYAHTHTKIKFQIKKISQRWIEKKESRFQNRSERNDRIQLYTHTYKKFQIKKISQRIRSNSIMKKKKIDFKIHQTIGEERSNSIIHTHTYKNKIPN